MAVVVSENKLRKNLNTGKSFYFFFFTCTCIHCLVPFFELANLKVKNQNIEWSFLILLTPVILNLSNRIHFTDTHKNSDSSVVPKDE